MLRFVKLNETAILPFRGSVQAAGFDLFANEEKKLIPNLATKVRLGIGSVIPPGLFGKLFDRSSMAAKGIVLSAGVIDSDYRGEWQVILTNFSSFDYILGKGDKIAQVVFLKVELESFKEISLEEFKEMQTKRGDGGFGSTGK